MPGLPADFLDEKNLVRIEGDLTRDPALRALAAEVLDLRHAAGPFIRSISFESGSFDAAIAGQAVETISIAFISHFKAQGAENFIEMNVHDRDDPSERYTITVQKVSGKSPGQLLGEAKERIRALEGASTP